MRRLSGIWGLVGLTAIACAFAAHAPAAPGPALFELSVTGTASQQWTHTAAPEVDRGCTRTVTTEGIRNVQFRTARPVVVRIVAGGVRAADVSGLTGTVTLVGANTIDENCGGLGVGRIEDCIRTRRTFSAARVRVSSRRRGFVDVGPVRRVRLRMSDCPREPAEVQERPLGPSLRAVRLPKAVRDEQRLARLTVRASASRRTAYAQPEAGTLRERAIWSLTFVRVKR